MLGGNLWSADWAQSYEDMEQERAGWKSAKSEEGGEVAEEVVVVVVGRGGIMPWQVRWASQCQAVYTGAERWRDGRLGSGPTWKRPSEQDTTKLRSEVGSLQSDSADWVDCARTPAATKKGVRVKGWRLGVNDRVMMSGILQYKSQRCEWYCHTAVTAGSARCIVQWSFTYFIL